MRRLSIITTLYNSARYLPKCLDSLLNQDIPESDYEVIIVNDGSPDNSKESALRYASTHKNIKIISQENKGLAGARNTGIRAAEGKFLYFVDPDDYILENSLGRILQKMDDDSLDVLRFGYSEVDEMYRPTSSVKHFIEPDYSPGIMDGYTFMSERLGVACYVWTYLFRSSLIKDNEVFFIEGQYFDDTPWLPRVLSKAKRVDSIAYKRHFYLIRKDSLVQSRDDRSINNKIDGELFLIREMTRQRDLTDNENGKKWYEMMIAHCTLSLLSYFSRFNYAERKKYAKLLDHQRVFPLSLYRANRRNSFKIRLANLSPNLFLAFLKFSSLINKV